jgi:hypothetical protein
VQVHIFQEWPPNQCSFDEHMQTHVQHTVPLCIEDECSTYDVPLNCTSTYLLNKLTTESLRLEKLFCDDETVSVYMFTYMRT